MERLYSVLAVGCTGKALFGVSGRLYWTIRLGLGTVSALKQTTTSFGLGTVSALKANYAVGVAGFMAYIIP